MLRYFIGKHKTKTVQMYVDVRYRKSLVKRFTRERKLKEQVERVCVCVCCVLIWCRLCLLLLLTSNHNEVTPVALKQQSKTHTKYINIYKHIYTILHTCIHKQPHSLKYGSAHKNNTMQNLKKCNVKIIHLRSSRNTINASQCIFYIYTLIKIFPIVQIKKHSRWAGLACSICTGLFSLYWK